MADKNSGLIYNIQRYSTEDGPGVRTTIFFQGCPLRCLWCSNPESKLLKPQLMHFSRNCTKCGSCVAVCPVKAIQILDDASVSTDRSICVSCGDCAKVCPADTRAIAGKWMDADEVMRIIDKDAVYYMNSGGGISFGGGECTLQPEFLATLVERCYQKGYHTCLDTCGHAPWGALEKVLEKIDLVLYDIKHMDPGKHREYTGVDNSLILENLGKIKQMNKKIIVRLPLIPKYNDDDSNITATGRFMKLWGLSRIDLLPYHNFGANKYDALAQEYPLVNTPALDKNRLNSKIEILESYGLTVEIA